MLYTFLFYLYIYSYISLYIILYKYTSSSHWQTYGRCDNTLLFCPAVFLTLDLSWQIQRLKTRAVGQLTRCDMTNFINYWAKESRNSWSCSLIAPSACGRRTLILCFILKISDVCIYQFCFGLDACIALPLLLWRGRSLWKGSKSDSGQLNSP